MDTKEFVEKLRKEATEIIDTSLEKLKETPSLDPREFNNESSFIFNHVNQVAGKIFAEYNKAPYIASNLKSANDAALYLGQLFRDYLDTLLELFKEFNEKKENLHWELFQNPPTGGQDTPS